MLSSHHLTAQVLPGGKIEICVPDLQEGQTVEITVVPTTPPDRQGASLLEFFNSLPPGPRSAASWEEFERQFQEERNSWDR